MTDSTATTTATDPIEMFKARQRVAWSQFAPLATHTTMPAGRLVRFAGVKSGQRVLDVACGTGVVAVTAAMHAGARVTAADLTPELLEVARENARVGGVEIDFHEADVEKLPFKDAEFDVVLSQFGHMFAPRPAVAVGEMLRVLKPGGTIAFTTWPPELLMGQTAGIIARHLPPPPPGVSPPPQWGDPAIVRERLGDKVRDLVFDRDVMVAPALSPAHQRAVSERSAGPMRTLVEVLEKSDPAKLAEVRRELDALAAQYFADNAMRQGYLLTKAIKK